MKKVSLVALLTCIIISVMVMWVQQPWSSRVFEICGFALAIIWLAAFLLSRAQPRWSLALAAPAGASAWAMIQLFSGATIYAWKTETAALYWSANAAFLLVALQVFADHHLRRRFLAVMTLFAGVLAIISTAQYYTADNAIFWIFQTDPEVYFGHIMGPFLNRNQYAAFMEMLLPIAMYNAVLNRRYSSWYAIATGIIYASVISSASRAGAVLTTLELLVVPLLLWRKGSMSSRGLLPALGVIVICVGALVGALGYEDVLDRLQNGDKDVTRSEFRTASIVMAQEHPWTGVGLGNWATAYPAYATSDNGTFANQAHNDWTQWAAEGGVPMLLLMALLALWALPKAVQSIWGIGVIAIFLHCWVDYPIERIGLATLFFVLLAALQYAHHDEHHHDHDHEHV